MAAGKEIKRLRGSIAAQTVADLIRVDVERLRKWESRDANPKDSDDVKKVEEYFGCKLDNLAELKSFQFVPKPPGQNSQELLHKYIESLERINKAESKTEAVARDLDVLKSQLKVSAGIQKAAMEMLLMIADEVFQQSKVGRNKSREILKRYKLEGSFLGKDN